MGKIRIGNDPRNKHSGSTFDSFLKQEKIELKTPSVEEITKKVMEAHKETFQKLADYEAAEKQKPETAPTIPEKVIEKTHTIERIESIKTIDKRARNHSIAVRNELTEMMVKKHALLNKAYELQKKRSDELASKIIALEARKPEEKQIVTKEHTIIKEKTSKRMLIICAATIVINVLILISK